MNIDNVIHGIEEGWKQALASEFNKEYFIDSDPYNLFSYEKGAFASMLNII